MHHDRLPSRRSRSRHLLVLFAAGALLGGCASSPPASAGGPRAQAGQAGEVHASNAGGVDEETMRRLREMEQAMSAEPRRDAGEPGFVIEDPPPAEGRARTDFWRPVDLDRAPGDPTDPAIVEADGVASGRVSGGDRVEREPERVLTRPERIRRHVGELAGLLRDDAREIGFMLPAWIRIAALEAIEPGALSAHYIPGGGEGPVSALSEPEHAFLTAWRDLHTSVWENADSADVAALAEMVDDAAARMRELRPLEIVRTALCTRVERYGVYEERKLYGGVHKLLAGKPQRLLVYMELENYAHREATEGGVDGLAVDLTVGLSLHHLGRESDLLAWRMADEAVSVFSRNQRREFFLTIIADLPETLSVDSYNLKARVTDENSGAVAERLIRIDIVADASAFTGGSH